MHRASQLTRAAVTLPRHPPSRPCSDDLASLDLFCAFFLSKTVTCGSNFILLWNVGTGSLEVSCSEGGPFEDADRAQPELVVASTKLCRALYDLHLGGDAITPALRKSVLEGARKL